MTISRSHSGHGFRGDYAPAVLVLRTLPSIAYRHALPPRQGAGNDCRNGRSWSTEGATEEAEGREGWGKHSRIIVETGEGGKPPRT